MNYNIPNLIIIWGNDDYNTLGLHRQLANHGLRLFFLICGGKKNIASKSKYCVSFHIANSIDDGLVYLYNNLHLLLQQSLQDVLYILFGEF